MLTLCVNEALAEFGTSMVLRLVHDSTAGLTLSMRVSMALTKNEGEPQGRG